MAWEWTEVHISKPFKKRPIRPGIHHWCRGVYANFKRPKVDAIRDFPSQCGALPPRIDPRKNEGHSIEKPGQVKQTDILGDSGSIIQPQAPSVDVAFAPPIDIKKSEEGPIAVAATGNLQASGQLLENDGQAERIDVSSSLGSMSRPSNAAVVKDTVARKFLPPRIFKNYPFNWDFPPGCGNTNLAAGSKNTALVNGNSSTDHKPSMVAVKTDLKMSEEEIKAKNALNGTIEENAGKNYQKDMEGQDLTDLISVKNLTSVSPSENSILATGMSNAEHILSKGFLGPEATPLVRAIPVVDALNVPLEENSCRVCEKVSVEQDKNDLIIVSADNHHRSKVRKALNLYEKTFTELSRKPEMQLKPNRHRSWATQVAAAMLLKKQQKWVSTSKQFGAIPGVNVGDRFHCRVELAVVGLHHPFQCGIDYVMKDRRLLAISIVASGRYANDTDSSDVLIYSGQGGNPTTDLHVKPEDQKLERGNLALKNSIDAQNPVRVIRGFKASEVTNLGDGRTLARFAYDGLYVVDEYWQERGKFGKLVFKFLLKRLSGQPQLTQRMVNVSKNSEATERRHVVHVSKGKENMPTQRLSAQPQLTQRMMKVSKKSKATQRLCVLDMSKGKEKMPIRAVNTIDDEKPSLFNYTTTMVYPEWYKLSAPCGCDCIDGCSDAEKCSCTVKNGGEMPFNHKGAIIEAKPLVYECGPSCKCPPSCSNRVSQHGIRFSLEVFKTESRGWGVRSRDFIPSGSFICEYVGELLHDKEADQRTGNDEYLFDIGTHNHDNILQDIGDLTIDAAQCGNVGRFMNHSCSPNLYAQNVLYDHDDKRAPHIMLFAAKNIAPLRELTYDYNYHLGEIRDCNGDTKMKYCYCGSRGCSGRMY